MPLEPGYLPGTPPPEHIPLARFLPPVPGGAARRWIETHTEPGDWVLDPFGASPSLAVELAGADRRVLVAAHNPIVRFILEMTAVRPDRSLLQTALAHLAAARVGDERLEPHLLDLYRTPCSACGQDVSADEFLWERGAEAPFARVYDCPNCGQNGRFDAVPFDAVQAQRTAATRLNIARILERVASLADPDRRHAEEALKHYPPRAIYALGTLVNKIDTIPADEVDLVSALMLIAFDHANTIWPFPPERRRPKQLTIPPRYRERNVFRALEAAVETWTADGGDPVPVTHYPALPEPGAAICIFEGRVRELADKLPEIGISAVTGALPRPNQAFWTLCALWAGWLDGREAVEPYKAVLRRQRYDWRWHATALHGALRRLVPQLPAETPVMALVPECEPGLLGAALSAGNHAGLEALGLALRTDAAQAQVHWRVAKGAPKPAPSPQETAAAAQAYLARRGEPAPVLPLLAAAATGSTDPAAAATPEPAVGSSADGYTQMIESLEDGLTYRSGFLRYNAGKELDVGQWWLREAPDTAPLADRVEETISRYLASHPGAGLAEVDAAACAAFPGLLTPDLALVAACVESYGELRAGDTWHLRPEDDPVSRKNESSRIREELSRLGVQLGFAVDPGSPLVWQDSGGIYRFYISTSAIFGDFFGREPADAGRRLIVLPGSRANLVLFKRERDPRLDYLLQDWAFVKFRHLRALLANPLVTRATIDEQLARDALTYQSPQINLF